MKWEYLFCFLGVILVNAMMKLTLNEKISRWVRYPCIGLICLANVSVISMAAYLGTILYHKEPMGAMLVYLFGLIVLAGAAVYVWSLYRTKRSRE